LGAIAIHAREEDVTARVRAETGGDGAHVAVDAVGSARALETACRVVRRAGTVSIVGVHTEPCAVHMGLIFLNGLRIVAGLANVIAHLDPVLGLMTAGRLDPSPLVTHQIPLADAAEAYGAFDRHETLKVLLRP
ncbi:MAG TPA: zinc-binding dehydrogenase, partial [Solirubrobacteraceae bacterium]|nr:zinc-binding dehydrogenase [Solirubrobacteraceae bacterium]